MIRLLTAAAMAALLATPVMAQSVSPSDRSGSSLENQGSMSSPGSSSSGSMSSQGTLSTPGLSGQTPSDCAPNDPRPECQTAQLPSDEEAPSPSSPGLSGSTDTSPSGSMTSPSERPGSSTWQGGSSSGSSEGSSSGSGSMGR